MLGWNPTGDTPLQGPASYGRGCCMGACRGHIFVALSGRQQRGRNQPGPACLEQRALREDGRRPRAALSGLPSVSGVPSNQPRGASDFSFHKWG